jgi:hypothetical protein
VIAWPVVKARLAVIADGLSEWSATSVYNGPVVTGDAPTEFFTVGFLPTDDAAGSYEQDRGLGDVPRESGTVLSELVCSSGAASDMPTVEAHAFSLLAALQTAVDADPTLGVLRQGSTSSLSVDVQPAQTTSGAVQRLTVTLSYVARV